MDCVGDSDNPIKLIYFSCRGTCDVIRLLLVDQEIPYEEHNVSGKDYLQSEFQTVLLESGNFPMLPFLSDPKNQVEITGSFTIMRYIGEKCKLMGNTSEDRIKIENWIEFLQSLLHSVWDFENTVENFGSTSKKGDKTGFGFIGVQQQNKKKSQFILDTLHPMLESLNYRIETELWALSCGYTIIDVLLYSTICVIVRSLGHEVLDLYKK